MSIALPEIFLALSGMAVLLVGLFTADGDKAILRVRQCVMLAMGMTVILILDMPSARMDGFSGFFVSDAFGQFIKILMLLCGLICVLMGRDYFKTADCDRFEIPILYLFATLGGMVMISANDFLPLYLGVELQALSTYTLIAVRRESAIPTEAGLKYFVLGALSSGFILYGISLIYGFAGSTHFENLAQTFAMANMRAGDMAHQSNIGVLLALVFVFAGMAFKLSAAPFHMWTPDVYHGAPTPVVAYMATVSKIAAVGLIMRVIVNPFNGLAFDYVQIIMVLSVLSMAVGSFGGLVQIDLKRLMGYSAIANIGFILLALVGLGENGVTSALLYVMIYAVTTLGIFGVILCMRQKDRLVSEISDLQGIASVHPILALCMAILLFSAAGIPPMAGFIAKLFVFQTVIEDGHYVLAVVGVLMSVVSAYYYLRIIRIMYMEEPLLTFDEPLPKEPLWVAGFAALVVFFFIFIPETSLGIITNVALLFIRG